MLAITYYRKYPYKMTEHELGISFDPDATPVMTDDEAAEIVADVMGAVGQYESRFPIIPFASGNYEVETRYEPALPLASEQVRTPSDESRSTEIRSVTETIISEVANYYGLESKELAGDSRVRSLVSARQMAAYIIRERTDFSYPAIGQFFGGRDHTTIISACRKIKSELETEKVGTVEAHSAIMIGLRNTLMMSPSGKFQTVGGRQTELVTLSRHGIVQFPVTYADEGAKRLLGIKGEFCLNWDEGTTGLDLWKKYGPAARAIMHFVARHTKGEPEFILSEDHIRDFLQGRNS